MSGGGSGGGGGGIPDPPSDCARFTKEVVLSSPNPAVLPTLEISQILALQFEPDSNNRVIQAVTDANSVAGSVTGETSLRNCMVEGHQYVAEVLKVQGGSCRVRIRVA